MIDVQHWIGYWATALVERIGDLCVWFFEGAAALEVRRWRR